MTKSKPLEKKLRFGAHISVAGGTYNAPLRGREIGCDTIQIFTRNQTQWQSKPLLDDEILRFKQAIIETNISPVVAHDSYLINLGSPEEAKWRQSCAAFDEEILRAEKLGIAFLVFHPGAHMQAGEDGALARIAEALNRAILKTPNYCLQLLIETTAGQGSSLGYRFEHLAVLIEKIEVKTRIGVCLDTCHVFAAGYELRSEEAYEQTIRQFDRIVGLSYLKALHLNDSKKELGSRVDRHEAIGQGYIGLSGFRNILNDARLSGLPMIVETPGEEADHARNLAVLRQILLSPAPMG